MSYLSAAEIAHLHRIIAERRIAYAEGVRDTHAAIRQASNAISAALDWPAEATALGEAERARRVRAQMLAPGVRVGDYMGRGRPRATARDAAASVVSV